MKSSTTSTRRVAAAAIVAAALPLAYVTPAHAATTLWGCTVDPEVPVYDHINPANGNKVIRYDMTVTCAAGRTVEIEQHIHEQDNGLNNDDHITDNTRSRLFSATDTVTMWWENTLPNTDIDREEMYHTVRFRVTTTNLAQSGWTSFEMSPVQSFSN